VLIAELVETSTAVAATRSRKAKTAALAATLARADADELPVVTSEKSGFFGSFWIIGSSSRGLRALDRRGVSRSGRAMVRQARVPCNPSFVLRKSWGRAGGLGPGAPGPGKSPFPAAGGPKQADSGPPHNFQRTRQRSQASWDRLPTAAAAMATGSPGARPQATPSASTVAVAPSRIATDSVMERVAWRWRIVPW